MFHCNANGMRAAKPNNNSKFGPIIAALTLHLRKNVVETSKPDPSVKRFLVKTVFPLSPIDPTPLTCNAKLARGNPTGGSGAKRWDQVTLCKSAR